MSDRVVTVARHGESELSGIGVVNGDPSVPCPLSALGRKQAAALHRALIAEPVELCATSTFGRARETADIAMADRVVERLMLPALDDLRFGRWEAGAITAYREWLSRHGPAARPPGGGESRADVVLRYCAAFRELLARPDRRMFVVGHGVPLGYLVHAAAGGDPGAAVEPVECAQPHRLSGAGLAVALGRLEAWGRRQVAA